MKAGGARWRKKGEGETTAGCIKEAASMRGWRLGDKQLGDLAMGLIMNREEVWDGR